MAATVPLPVIPTGLVNATSIPECSPIACAPCYISATPSIMTYPGDIDIRNETYTLDVTPHVTKLSNGNFSTSYETAKMNMSTTIFGTGSVPGLQLEEAYTWVVPGPGDLNLTLTYPTTYLDWDHSLIGTAVRASQTTATCAGPATFTPVNLPRNVNPSCLIALPSSTTSGQDNLTLPDSILSCLDSLPEVQEQFNHIPLISCSSIPEIPPICTSVTVLTSTDCTVGHSGNLSHTHCTDKPVTSVVTQYTTKISGNIQVGVPTSATEGTILVPRKPAAYLTYNTLTPSSEATDLLNNMAPAPEVIASPTQIHHQQTTKPSPHTGTNTDSSDQPTPDPVKQSGGNESPPPKPAVPAESPDGQDAKPSGDASPDRPDQNPPATSAHSGYDFGNLESAIDGLASQASASRESASPAESAGSQDGEQSGERARPQPTPGSNLGNLWSAIQSVASNTASSLRLEPTSPPESASGTDGPSDTRASPIVASQAAGSHDAGSQESGSDNSGSSQLTEDAGNVNIVPGSGASPTNDGAGNVHNTGTGTINVVGPTASESTASAIPVFTFQGQTLTPGDAATFGGSPVSELPNKDGVVVDGSQTVHVSDGQITTVHQSGQKPITISRSGSVLVVDDQTLSPGQQITAGQTTASLARSTGVLYVDGTATTLVGPSITVGGTVYTATAAGTSTSGDDLGGYIYSGIGGSSTAEGSPGGSSTTTGIASSIGVRHTLSWAFYGWILTVVAWRWL